MLGLMQDRPLGLGRLRHRTERPLDDKMVATASGDQHPTYDDCFEFVRRLAYVTTCVQVSPDPLTPRTPYRLRSRNYHRAQPFH